MLDLGNMILAEINPLKDVVVKELYHFYIGDTKIVISNHMFMITLAALLLGIVLPLTFRRKGLVPSGFRNLIESICVFLREEVARPFLGKSTDKHVGFVWTIFFFILTLNLLGMVPLGRVITVITGMISFVTQTNIVIKPNHFEGAATANIWVVGALAIVAFFAIHISGIRQQGVLEYFKNFAPKVPWPMWPFIFFLELVGAMVRPVSLAIRLFANMFAGHVLIATLFLFIIIFRNYYVTSLSVVAVVLASFLELLVAFLQAYIFTFLTSIFMGFAVNPDH